MAAARVGRILGRWWWFVAVVTIATIAASLVWQTVGPVPHRAEAELLLVLELPPDSEDRQFGIENSRAQASSVVIQDLVRLARGRNLHREVIEELGKENIVIDLETLIETIEVFPFARGLRLELTWQNPLHAQAIIDTTVRLLVDDQTRLYPSLKELGTLRVIDKTDSALQPTFATRFLDIFLKALVGLLTSMMVVLVFDWRGNRLFSDDVPDLLDTPIIGTVQ